MKIAASFLDIKGPIQEEVTKLSNLDVDYLHQVVVLMSYADKIFVKNINKKIKGY